MSGSQIAAGMHESPAPNDAALAFIRARRIDERRLLIIPALVPVGAPLPDIPQHIEKAEPVGELGPDRVGPPAGISRVPGDIVEITVKGRPASAPAAFLPLRLRRQPEFEARLDLELFQKFLTILIGHARLGEVPLVGRRVALLHDFPPCRAGYLVFADPDSFRHDVMDWAFVGFPPAFAERGTHQEIPAGDEDHFDPEHQPDFPKALKIFLGFIRIKHDPSQLGRELAVDDPPPGKLFCGRRRLGQERKTRP